MGKEKQTLGKKKELWPGQEAYSRLMETLNKAYKRGDRPLILDMRS